MVVVVTGGGSRAISDLLCVPGGSRTLLEALVPYGSKALVEFLAAEPEHFCAEPTARIMAVQAYTRAVKLREDDRPVVGVGATASLVSDRPKRGPHRCHVASQTDAATESYSVVLTKGRRTRLEEELGDHRRLVDE